jgi:hypothetical protein
VYQYRLLATSKTSTMQRELQDASDAGYTYVGQTVFETLFAGREVVCILEREDGKRGDAGYVYELRAIRAGRPHRVEDRARRRGAGLDSAP